MYKSTVGNSVPLSTWSTFVIILSATQCLYYSLIGIDPVVTAPPDHCLYSYQQWYWSSRWSKCCGQSDWWNRHCMTRRCEQCCRDYKAIVVKFIFPQMLESQNLRKTKIIIIVWWNKMFLLNYQVTSLASRFAPFSSGDNDLVDSIKVLRKPSSVSTVNTPSFSQQAYLQVTSQFIGHSFINNW